MKESRLCLINYCFLAATYGQSIAKTGELAKPEARLRTIDSDRLQAQDSKAPVARKHFGNRCIDPTMESKTSADCHPCSRSSQHESKKSIALPWNLEW